MREGKEEEAGGGKEGRRRGGIREWEERNRKGENREEGHDEGRR